MGAEHEQIFPAGPRVLFAPAAQFEQLADRAIGEALLRQLDQRRDAHLVRDRQLRSGAVARSEDLVGLGRASRYRLVHVDAGGACLCRRPDHLEVPLRPAGGDRDQVRPLPAEHFVEVGIGGAGPEAFGCLFECLWVIVGHRCDLDIRQGFPNHVEPVAIVAAPGAPDDADPIFPHRHGVL